MFEIQLASFVTGMVFGMMCLSVGILIALFVAWKLRPRGEE